MAPCSRPGAETLEAPGSYDRDFYTWSQEQGRLVREGRWSEAEAVARAHRKARLEAANETGLPPSRLSEACPYSFADITSRAFDHEAL